MNMLHHIPFWVWLLLALLIALGMRQSQALRMPRRRVIAIPLALTVYSLFSLSHLLHRHDLLLPGLLLWGVCNVLTCMLARPLFAPALAHESSHLIVPGSWAPLVLYLTIFSLRFVHGMLSATQPTLAQDATTLMALAALSALLSGLLNARALRLIQPLQAR